MVVRRAAIVAGLVLLTCSCGNSVRDPADAACPDPPATFGVPVNAPDHREVGVHFTCEGARLRARSISPRHGDNTRPWSGCTAAGEQPRLRYGPLVAAYINDGIAFFTYDKRGVGESEGECCPDVYGHFNLVTADAVGAVEAARSYSRDRSGPSWVPWGKRGRLGRTARRRGIGSRRLSRRCQSGRPSTQHRGEVRGVRRRK